MKLIKYPDPFLRRRVRPVEAFDEALSAEVTEMFAVMRDEVGCGLAGTQVALDKRVAIINITGEPTDCLVLINPEITQRRGKQSEEEGCLSVPGIRAVVRRAASVRVRALDLQGKPFEMEAEELLAVAVQHELDHLDGILFIDKIGPATRIGIRQRLQELEKSHSD